MQSDSPETTAERTVFIYALIDPDTQEVRYVGKTVNLKSRYNGHIHYSNGDTNYHKRRWINRLRREGKRPLQTVLAEVSEQDWETEERYWISFYRRQGADLLNLNDGGYGRRKTPRSEEQREEDRRFRDTPVTLTDIDLEDVKILWSTASQRWEARLLIHGEWETVGSFHDQDDAVEEIEALGFFLFGEHLFHTGRFAEPRSLTRAAATA